MKIFRRLQLRTQLLFLALLAMNGLVAHAQLPTTNLFVNLNGNSVENFVSDGTVIQVWKDLAEDGSDASRQDFGQANVNKQPTLVTNGTVPNSAFTNITYNLLDFERGTPLNNANSSTANSDYFNGKTPDTARPANYGDPFTSGRDTAYEAGNLVTGLSWFIVFQNTDDTVIHTNNGAEGTGTRRWGTQAMIDSRYLDISAAPEHAGSGRFVWGENALDTLSTATPTPGDADSLANLNHYMRNNNGTQTNHPYLGGPPVNLGLSQWYMCGNTYDPVNGVFHSLVTTPDGAGGVTILVDQTTTDALLINPLGVASGKELVRIALRHRSDAPTTNNRDLSFDGMMAEVLVYNTALGATEFAAAVDYLNEKYFEYTNLPGDYNADGRFDAADYVLWRKNDSGNAAGYNSWRAGFGASGSGSSVGGGSAVPEPGAIALLACAVLATIGASRTRSFNAVRRAPGAVVGSESRLIPFSLEAVEFPK